MLPVINTVMQSVYGGNSGYAASMGQQTSLIGRTTLSANNVEDQIYSNRFETPAMYYFVRDFHLTKAILNLFQSFISDLYRDSELTVKVIGYEEKLTLWLNEYIKEVDLKKNALDNIDDFLFWGNQGKYLDHESSGFRHLTNPVDFAVYFENDIPKMSIVGEEFAKVRGVRYYNGLWMQYRPKTVKAFSDDTQKDNPDAGIYYESEYKKGESIFKGVILRLYSMFIKEYLLDQMSLKEALKNEVIVANIQDPKTSMQDINQAVDMISNLINDQESMSILSKSPQALLRIIDEKMVNYVNVVPGIQNFTNFDKMDVYSLRDKLQMLQDDLDKDEAKVLKTLGIPDELMNGSSTRWEALERSSRFATVIAWVNSYIIQSIQYFCQAQIYYKFKMFIPIAKIQINTDTSTILSAPDNAYKYRNFQDSIEAIRTAADTYKDLAQNEVVDPDKLYDFFHKKLSSIDSSVSNLFKKFTQTTSSEE